MVPNHEKKGDHYVYLSLSQFTDKFWLQKNDGKKSFFYETKASMTFILMRRICLCCPIMRRKEIITCIHVCLYSRMNIDSKESHGKKSFSDKTNASLWLCLWCPIVKRKEIIACIHICPNWRMNFNSKKNGGKKAFLIKPKHQCHLSQ